MLLTDLDEAGVAASAELLRSEGIVAEALATNVADSSDNDHAAALARERFGSLDIWVANAGIYPANPTDSMTDEQWLSVIDVNLNGAYYGARAAFREMQGDGTIIFIASTASWRAGGDGRAHYVAAKHGVRGLVAALAREWGRSGVRVNAAAPGYTLVRPSDLAPGAEQKVAERDREWLANIPLGRAGRPEDLANAVLFCASSMSSMVNGVTIPVDGGQLTV